MNNHSYIQNIYTYECNTIQKNEIISIIIIILHGK